MSFETNLDNLFTPAKSVRLSKSEHILMRAKIIATVAVKLATEYLASWLRSLRMQKLGFIAVSLMIFLMLASGGAYAVGQAQPGDWLYPTKQAITQVVARVNPDPVLQQQVETVEEELPPLPSYTPEPAPVQARQSPIVSPVSTTSESTTLLSAPEQPSLPTPVSPTPTISETLPVVAPVLPVVQEVVVPILESVGDTLLQLP